MANVIIPPTVGRVVWFRPSEFDPITRCDQPLAAQIAYVWNDRLVNLGVLDSNGAPHGRTSITLIQAGETAPEGASYAEWMPYQQGQAAKTEAAEAKAAAVATDTATQGAGASGAESTEDANA
ncbi:hypothetical protein [Bradyrhizobium uaiense]|uniref:Uncharacterized protein n=1 Tax=Bradyrhizobium uaiense TaxID=2594946 RepID=A0A6P1BAX5_9BRAD|nr:hypothetical protein [Bradyrhizobium uaiense]NEU94800.1 hypothetical protein [Bradyrhizobium uaiense]